MLAEYFTENALPWLVGLTLAVLAALLLACRQITYEVAQLMDAGSGDMEASAAKLFASKTAEWLTREAKVNDLVERYQRSL